MSFASPAFLFQPRKGWHTLSFRAEYLRKLVSFQRQGTAGAEGLRQEEGSSCRKRKWIGHQLLIPRPAQESAEAKGDKQNLISVWRVLTTMATSTWCLFSVGSSAPPRLALFNLTRSQCLTDSSPCQSLWESQLQCRTHPLRKSKRLLNEEVADRSVAPAFQTTICLCERYLLFIHSFLDNVPLSCFQP